MHASMASGRASLRRAAALAGATTARCASYAQAARCPSFSHRFRGFSGSSKPTESMCYLLRPFLSPHACLSFGILFPMLHVSFRPASHSHARYPVIAALSDRNKKVAIYATAAVVAVSGLSYASVPLYQLFCQATGYGGTTQQVTEEAFKTVKPVGTAITTM